MNDPRDADTISASKAATVSNSTLVASTATAREDFSPSPVSGLHFSEFVATAEGSSSSFASTAGYSETSIDTSNFSFYFPDVSSRDTPFEPLTPAGILAKKEETSPLPVVSAVGLAPCSPEPHIPTDLVAPAEGSSLSGVAHTTRDLPLKPLIPAGILATDPIVKKMETCHELTTRIFDSQQAEIESTKSKIEILTHLLNSELWAHDTLSGANQFHRSPFKLPSTDSESSDEWVPYRAKSFDKAVGVLARLVAALIVSHKVANHPVLSGRPACAESSYIRPRSLFYRGFSTIKPIQLRYHIHRAMGKSRRIVPPGQSSSSRATRRRGATRNRAPIPHMAATLGYLEGTNLPLTAVSTSSSLNENLNSTRESTPVFLPPTNDTETIALSPGPLDGGSLILARPPTPDPLSSNSTGRSRASTPILQEDVAFMFQRKVHHFETDSAAVIAEQLTLLDSLKDREALLERQCEALNKEIVEDLAAREREYQCPLCLSLAWDSYVLRCGHSFCSKCLNQRKAEHERKRQDDPQTAEALVPCPICRSSIIGKPLRSVTIQAGVKSVAAELLITVPPSQSLQWA
ncbi:hypothetical protein C8R42DRAFT_649093 [Lentinula raphanica]|nr:hypothetical protein C8R42DRAFT_649093 [Lentinula raphanica]